MKGVCLFFMLSVGILMGCKDQGASSKEITTTISEDINLPAQLKEVMDAHGGLDTWNKQRSMSYEMVTKDKKEKQYIDLRDRREVINTGDYSMGFDGE